ncbi:MAG: hypothetical protein VKP70_01070 [Cyanobacteriota bacterium]|nr:hypothetical protein [Cyanobacteriota bacterium]
MASESERQRAAFGADRYAAAIFVCRSVDPPNTALNLREKPAGRILGILSPPSVLYIRGQDLENAVQGYVPIRFYLEMTPATQKKGAGSFFLLPLRDGFGKTTSHVNYHPDREHRPQGMQ